MDHWPAVTASRDAHLRISSAVQPRLDLVHHLWVYGGRWSSYCPAVVSGTSTSPDRPPLSNQVGHLDAQLWRLLWVFSLEDSNRLMKMLINRLWNVTTQRWGNAGPASTTLNQHCASVGPLPVAAWPESGHYCRALSTALTSLLLISARSGASAKRCPQLPGPFTDLLGTGGLT